MAVVLTVDSSVMLYVVTAVFALLLYFWMLKKRWVPSLPPGPSGLPVLGNLPFLGPDLHRCFAALSRTYGPVMTIRLGCRLCVVLSSASATREALKDNDLTFSSHDVPAAALSSLGMNLVWTPHGPLWRMLRKVCVHDLLCAHGLKTVRPLRERVLKRMVAELHAKQGRAVVIQETVFVTMLNVMTAILWGGTIDDEGKGKEFKQAMDGIIECLGKANVSDFFPFLARFDIQGVAGELMRLRDWYFRMFDAIVEQRRKSMKADEGLDTPRDFLQVMLEMVDRVGESRLPLTIEHVRGVFLDLVAGGTDTTSTSVEWAMAELLNNPVTMQKLRDELDTVVGATKPVEESDMPRLPYLRAVMKETFRLHPATPLLIPYSPSSSVNVSGFKIPKGAKVFVNVWAIHTDPLVWANPLRFEPERFLSGVEKCDYGGHNYNYLPFGSGRRICPGILLAEKMVSHLLASLVHSFEWQLPDDTNKVDLTDNFGIVLKKERPLVAIPSARLGKS